MAAGLAIGTGAAYLGDQAVEEIFGGERFPVIAGQGTRPGTAVAQDGGHLLSGSWQFASGIKHSGFIHTLGVVEGTGEPRIFVLPVEQATLIDNWDVMGLRATGSIDYEIDSVFVPEHFSHFAVTETPERGGDLYRLGIINIAGICHSGWALGIARRLMDELAKMVQAKAGRPGALAENQSFQEGFARAEGIRRAARALIFETWTDVDRDARARRGACRSTRTRTSAWAPSTSRGRRTRSRSSSTPPRGPPACARARSSSSSATCTRAPST